VSDNWVIMHEVVVTTDTNPQYQQTLHGRRIAILVLWTTRWPDLRPQADLISDAAGRLAPGEFRELAHPS